jgi:diguanylate cyclase (GGDEF)-like protein
MIDIDRFKAINDRFGHAAGDQVLRDVAAIMKEAAREDETIARIGGEEFVLISASSGLRELIVAAERLRRRLESTSIEMADRSIKLTASIGIAERESIHVIADMLLSDADEALYAAKSGGRNRIFFAKDGRIHPVGKP